MKSKPDHRRYSLHYCYKLGCRCFHCTESHRQYYRRSRTETLKRQTEYAKLNAVAIRQYKKDWFQQNKKSLRLDSVRRLYGLTREEYLHIHQKQHGKCAICARIPSKTLCVDHCHETKVVRGLLCNQCNSAIGLLGNNVVRLQRAIKYLQGEGH